MTRVAYVANIRNSYYDNNGYIDRQYPLRDARGGEKGGPMRQPITPMPCCAYGFHVGCGVAAALRERGFDAKYLRGGLAAWYAAGGERALKPRNDA